MDQFHIREHLKSQFPYTHIAKLVANGINYPGRTQDSRLGEMAIAHKGNCKYHGDEL